MNMKERLLDDLKTALREKDVLRKDMVQIIRAGILQVEKDTLQPVDEAMIFDIMGKEYKKRAETVKELENKGRQDIIDKTLAEMAIIEAYMPAQLTEAEIEALVGKVIEQTGAHSARDMGTVMKVLLPEVKGRADGKLVNLIVRRLLG